jgi:hypothetical protein
MVTLRQSPIRVLNGKVIVWLVTGSYAQEP